MWQTIEDAYKGTGTKLIQYLKIPVMGIPCQSASIPPVLSLHDRDKVGPALDSGGNLTFRTISILEILLSAPIEEPDTLFVIFWNCSSLDGDHKFLFLKWVLWSQPAGTRSILLVFTVQMLSLGGHQYYKEIQRHLSVSPGSSNVRYFKLQTFPGAGFQVKIKILRNHHRS